MSDLRRTQALKQTVARLLFRRRIAALEGDAAAAPIAHAMRAALEAKSDVDFERWSDRIEAKRRELARIDDRVTMRDFGAGGSDEGVDREVRLGEFYSEANVDPLSSAFLFHLVRELKPASCIELGTCTGLSAAYQGAALEVNGSGRLVTIEGDAELARRARVTLRDLEIERVTVVSGRFEDMLPGVLREHAPVDFVFNDGHHEEEATIRYFDTMGPHLAPGAVVVLDDVNWSGGMRRAFQRLSARSDVTAAVDLLRMGVLRIVSNEL